MVRGVEGAIIKIYPLKMVSILISTVGCEEEPNISQVDEICDLMYL